MILPKTPRSLQALYVHLARITAYTKMRKSLTYLIVTKW